MPLFIHPAEVTRPAATAYDAKYCSQYCDITCAHDCSFLTNHRIVFDDDRRWQNISSSRMSMYFASPHLISSENSCIVYHPKADISKNSTHLYLPDWAHLGTKSGQNTMKEWREHKIKANFELHILEIHIFEFFRSPLWTSIFYLLSKLPGTFSTIVALDGKTLYKLYLEQTTHVSCLFLEYGGQCPIVPSPSQSGTTK